MSSPFITPLRIEMIPCGKRFHLLEDFKVITKDGTEIICPKGMISDGPSIPEKCQSFVTVLSEIFLPSIPHDLMYAMQWPKEQADTIFLELMKSNGVGHFEALAVYEAVVLGGHPAYLEDGIRFKKAQEQGILPWQISDFEWEN